MRLAILSVPDLAGVIALNALRSTLTQHDARIYLCDDPHPVSLSELQYFMSDLPRQTFFPLIEERKRANAAFMTATEIGETYSAPVTIFMRPEWPHITSDLFSFQPDILFLVRFPLILKGPLLSLAPLGAYNVHSGHLPRYRGLLAPFRAMINGDKAAGCTLHRVDTGIDSGPVIGSCEFPIQPERSFVWNACHLYPLGVAMFEELLVSLAHGRAVKGNPQSAEGGRYYRLPDEAEITSFLDAGFRFAKFDDYLTLLRLFTDGADSSDLERFFSHRLRQAS